MVWADSRRISRVRRYSGIVKGIFSFQIQDYNPLWSTFPSSSLKKIFYPSNSFWWIQYNPTTPYISNDQNLTLMGFGLFPVRSSLLRESLYDFFSSGYWDISLHQVLALWHPGIRDRFPHSDIYDCKRLLAPHRSFSQPITSFILFFTQGIHF